MSEGKMGNLGLTNKARLSNCHIRTQTENSSGKVLTKEITLIFHGKR